MLETLGAPAPARRRKRRARETAAGTTPAPLPFARATTVRAFAPFADVDEGNRWLEQAIATEASVDTLLAEGVDAVNRALHAHSVASGDPALQILSLRRAIAARIGYGSGEQVASGEFSAAREVDVHAGATSRRRQRTEELRPQERIAAVLGGREQLDACETLILRARTDLDAGRQREAALQLRVGLEALLVELQGALPDPGHEEDMATLNARRHEAGELANTALNDDLDVSQVEALGDLLSICERVLRRRRILQG